MNEAMRKVSRRSIRNTQETLKEVIFLERELQGLYNQQREPALHHNDGQSLVDKMMSSNY